MFFIWTNDGGPLQYIGLVLFLLQMILPQVLLWLDREGDDEANDDKVHTSFHLSQQQQQQQQRHLYPLQKHKTTSTTTSTTTTITSTTSSFNDHQPPSTIPWGLIMMTLLLFSMIMIYLSVHRSPNHNNNNNNNNNNVPVEEQPRNNPRPETGGDDDRQPPPLQQQQQEHRLRRRIAQFWGLEGNPRMAGWTQIILFMIPVALVLIFVMLMTSTTMLHGPYYYQRVQQNVLLERPSDRTHHYHYEVVNDNSYWIQVVLQWMAFLQTVLSVIGLSSYLYPWGGQRRRNNNIMGWGGGPAAGDQPPTRRTFTRQQQEAKMNKMIELVHHVPIEMFVPQQEEELNRHINSHKEQTGGGSDSSSSSSSTYSSLSVTHLKQMLHRRGIPKAEIDCFVERKDLVDRLKQCRKYADSCCICFEPYQQGDTLRILPKCHHELHVDCFDNWVYTFANQPAKLTHEPSCPLCKETLNTTTSK
jgi:hypothetical protein